MFQRTRNLAQRSLERSKTRICYSVCYAFALVFLSCNVSKLSLAGCVGLVALLHFFIWNVRWEKMQMCCQMRWLFEADL